MKLVILGIVSFLLLATMVSAAVILPAKMTVKAPYPKGMEYVFECHAKGFKPTGYDWDFKDGEKLFDIKNDNVFHIYTRSGLFVPACTAADGRGHVAIGWIAIHVVGG